MKRIILILVCSVVMLGTNAYAGFVVYDGGGGQSRIVQAMGELGLTIDVLRGPGDPVTSADLANPDHYALIVGFNGLGGNMSGLNASVLETGITGNILITGHDADFHVVEGNPITGSPGDAVDEAATKFLSQAISFAASSSGTGLVVLGDYASSTPWGYLPLGWGISATGDLLDETIESITPEGVASGVYNDLTAADMSNWGQSYHTDFDSYDDLRFEVFENHHSIVRPVTIGYVVPVQIT